jgi:isoamylase
MSTASALTLPRCWAARRMGSTQRRVLRRHPAGPGPVSRVKLIAEPWDVGPGGYQLGAYPHPFLEWNDRFRDGVRRFWKGDAGMTRDLAARILGSADRFDHSGRAATSSVNFVTSHDGFTLEDLVSFTVKRNLANGEDNRDGHHENHSDNLGTKGRQRTARFWPPGPCASGTCWRRCCWRRACRCLLAGDEIGHSQGGNNNAYAQDNETSWIDWATADEDLLRFVSRLAALRRSLPVLRQRRFLHARQRQSDGLPDVIWRRADGTVPQSEEWHDPAFRCLVRRDAHDGRGRRSEPGCGFRRLHTQGPRFAAPAGHRAGLAAAA